jgi:lysophospholipase L1-like esterase
VIKYKNMARILVFGDSISHGKWDYKMGGWVQRLSNFLDEKGLSDPNFDYSVYNLSISGDTTEEIFERFEFEAKQRLKEEGGIIIFAIGLNDSCSGRLAVSPAKFRENIQKLIDLARKFSSKIIFIGLTPVEDSKVNPMPWAPDMSYSLKAVKKYNEILKSVSNENNVYFVEIFEGFVKENYKELLQDGAHPNSKGHKKIFEIVKDFLVQKKIIK